MRGAPFGWENLSLGLNTIDSPYTLRQGETRECLNVIATPRGAIRKRYGSQALATSAVTAFTEPAVTDNFNRAGPSPGANWSTTTGYTNDGELVGEQWKGETSSGARWNVAEQSNPAVMVDFVTLSGAVTNKFYLYVCLKAAEHTGYRLQIAKGSPWTWELQEVVAGTVTVLAKVSNALEAGDKIGLSLRGKSIIGWRKNAGSWSKVVEVSKEGLTTKGYCGIAVSSSAGSSWTVDNFAMGEQAASSLGEEAVQSLFKVEVSGTPYLIAAVGKRLYSINAAGEVAIIKEGLTESAAGKWSCVQATSTTVAGSPNKKVGGPVWLSNGVDKPLYWTAAAKNTEAKTWEGESGSTYFENTASKEHVPNGKYMVYAGNRIWMAGMSDDKSAVRMCDFSSLTEGGKQCDPTAWPKENVIRFDTNDGEPITGLGVIGPYILIFKRHKSYAMLATEPEGTVRKLSDTIGCIASRSIVETQQGTFFLTPDHGVFVTNGTSLTEISYNVRLTFQGLDELESRSAATSELEKSAAGFLNGHYYLSYVAKDGTHKTLDYDVVLKSWWLHDLAGNQWVVWEPSANVQSLYICLPTSGIARAFVQGVYTDLGSNYTGARGFTAYWISPWEPFWQYILRHRIKAPNQKKRIRYWFIDGSGQVIPFYFVAFKTAITETSGVVNEADQSKPETPDQLTELGGERLASACRIYALGAHRTWSFGFGNKSAEPFEIDAMQFGIQFRKS